MAEPENHLGVRRNETGHHVLVHQTCQTYKPKTNQTDQLYLKTFKLQNSKLRQHVI